MFSSKFEEIIKKALMQKEESITVPYYKAEQLFQQILNDYPSIAETIEQVRYSELLLGGVFLIKYKETTAFQVDALIADTAEQVEEILHKSIRTFETDVVISVDKSIDIGAVYSNFMVAYQGYYSNLLSIECRQQTIMGRKQKTVHVFFKYRIGRVKLTMMENEVNKKVNELNRVLFCDEMLPETKAFIAHNYLAKTVSYWLDDKAKPLDKSYMQSAYGALINKRCVCQGYAEAYKRILDSQSIICEVICGKIKGSPDHHAWNVVSFNGIDYHHIDVTWDAQQSSTARYKYFGLMDDDLQSSRIWTRKSNIICNCKRDILEVARLQIARNGSKFAIHGVDKQYFK